MQRPLLFIASLGLVLAGCAGQDKAPTAPGGVDIVTRCAEVLSVADNLFPTDRYPFIAEHCVVPMLREPKCKDAVIRSLTLDATTRSRTVADACTRAYCSRIRADKPELCSTEFTTLSSAELRPLGLQLFARVRELELGAAESKRWDAVIGSPGSPPTQVATAPPAKVEPPTKTPPPAKTPPPTKVEPKAPAKVEPKPPAKVEPKAPAKVEPKAPAKVEPKPPAKVEPKVPPKVPTTGGIRIHLEVRDRALYVVIGEDSWRLSEKPGPNDFDDAANRVVELAKRAARVFVEVGKDIQYHQLIGMLNALGARGIRDIAIVSPDE